MTSVSITTRESHTLDTLNLGAGDDTPAACWNVDIEALPGVDQIHNLNEYPWPWPDDSWSTIKTHHLLEHLEEPLRAAEEIARLLQPGGEWSLRYPIGHTRFEDPTHRHHWGWHTAAALVGEREHSHEFVRGFETMRQTAEYEVPSRGWRTYARLREWYSGLGPWLSQVPGLSGEVRVSYRRVYDDS